MQGTPTHLPAEVLVKRKKRLRGGGETWEVVRARGHLDEVQELRASVPPGAPATDLLCFTGPTVGGTCPCFCPPCAGRPGGLCRR